MKILSWLRNLHERSTSSCATTTQFECSYGSQKAALFVIVVKHRCRYRLFNGPLVRIELPWSAAAGIAGRSHPSPGPKRFAVVLYVQVTRIQNDARDS